MTDPTRTARDGDAAGGRGDRRSPRDDPDKARSPGDGAGETRSAAGEAVGARSPRGHAVRIIGVIGAGRASAHQQELAREVGRGLAAAGAVVMTGGRTGVMEWASRGAKEAGGTTLAILPGSDGTESPPNPFVDIPVFTGMSDARNAVIVRTAAALIAIGGSYGTLSEIGLAAKIGKRVVLLESWNPIPPAGSVGTGSDTHLLVSADNPDTAVRRALEAARG